MAATKKQGIAEDVNRLYPAQVCDLLGITARTLKNWRELEEDSVPVVQNDGTDAKLYPFLYDWPRVLAWYVRREVNKDLRRLGDVPADKAEAEMRDKSASALLRELKLLKEQERLVEAEKVEEVWTSKILTTRQLLMTVPQRVTGQILASMGPDDIRQLMEREIEIALKALAGKTVITSDQDEDEEDEDGE